MKPVALGAGSRRDVLKAGAGLLAALCAGYASARLPRANAILQPLLSINGARLMTRTDILGGVTPDAIGQYVPLVFPVAVAASFNDIYIADAGSSRLYRYDRALNAMAVMPVTGVTQATRLHAGPDGSLYVLDASTSQIRRYTRGGQALPGLRPRLGTSRYVSFTVDPLTGKAYAVDSLHLTIDEIQPLGQLSIELQRLDEAGPITTDGRGLFVASSRCGCITEWIQGRAGRRFGVGKLRQPVSIAIDGPNLYAIDRFDRSLALVHEEGIESLSAASLGLLTPETLTSAGGMILVADSAGHQIAAFRPRAKRSS